jgi:predicted Rdx family selenoprotein
MMKSFWYAQELLTTFAKTDGLDAITILPSTKDQTGIFIMRLLKMTTTSFTEDDDDTVTSNEMILWDRKAESGFPQPKEIKQQIRDVIDPDKYLGHSDTEQRKVEMTNEVIDLTSSTPTTLTSVGGPLKLHLPNAPTPSVTITYCTGCQWLLRAAYLGQELLSTFGDGQIASITLVPSRPPAKGGQFVSFGRGSSQRSWSRPAQCPRFKS